MSDIVLNKIAAPPSGVNTGEASISVSALGDPQYTDGDTGLTKTFKSIFGSNYHANENAVPSTNTTTAFQNYLTLPYSGLDDSPTAIYKVSLFFIWGYSSAARDYRGYMTLNNSQVGEEFRVEPKDGGADQRLWESSWNTFTGAEMGTSGVVGYDYAAQNAGDTARTYEARLEIIRVK